MNRPKRNETGAQDAQVILGITGNLANVATLTLAGTTITPTELAARLQARIDSGDAVAAARARWHDLVAADRALSSTLTPLLRGLRQYLLNTHGTDATPLADFGMQPPKKATVTPEVTVAAVAKRAATRKARHTMGPVQRKAVKGTTSPVVPAPATSPPTEPSAGMAPSQGTTGGGAPHA